MEMEAEKDARVRRKVKAIYNKMESSFSNSQAFRDYEEEVEDVIFNLVHGIDVDETQARIKKYAALNEESIAFNAGKQSEEDQIMDKQIRLQGEELQRKIHESHKAEEDERNYKREHKRQVNQLMLGERDSVHVTKEAAFNAAAVGGTSAESEAAASQQMLSNQQSIYMLLNPRELPKTTKTKAFDRKALSLMKKDDVRRMHAAAGYDHTEWFRKSWIEAVSTVGESAKHSTWD